MKNLKETTHENIQIYIGYDSNTAVAYHVLSHSIHARATHPVSITPVKLSEIKKIYNHPCEIFQSTEYSFSRFLVPYLNNYRGWALYMDCDMLVLKDISKLWSLRDSRYAVMCTKHDHIPREKKKALGVPQKIYDKKNWSSLMLMNCTKCTVLTPNYVNNTKGLALHQFDWLKSDKQIGSIPLKWNHLVDFQEVQPPNKIANLHFTSGGPYFNDYTNCGYATVWINELQNMINSKQTQNTKHVQTKKQSFLKLFKKHN
jgi:hypothetical protein